MQTMIDLHYCAVLGEMQTKKKEPVYSGTVSFQAGMKQWISNV